MKTTVKELNAMVMSEAKKLKKHATKEELASLDFSELGGKNRYNCIYGQTTGDCFSDRAGVLIGKCCSKAFGREITRTLSGDTFKDVEVINPKKESPRYNSAYSYFSPIEIFIARGVNMYNGNNKRLINFLKGETKTLRLV